MKRIAFVAFLLCLGVGFALRTNTHPVFGADAALTITAAGRSLEETVECWTDAEHDGACPGKCEAQPGQQQVCNPDPGGSHCCGYIDYVIGEPGPDQGKCCETTMHEEMVAGISYRFYARTVFVAADGRVFIPPCGVTTTADIMALPADAPVTFEMVRNRVVFTVTGPGWAFKEMNLRKAGMLTQHNTDRVYLRASGHEIGDVLITDTSEMKP